MGRAYFFWLFVAGCSGAPETAAARPLHDYRGIIHCHSLYSHDSKGTYEEILAAAKAARVDFICMTDHPPRGDHGLSLREGWAGLHDGVLFIQGAEYSDNILGLGLREPISGKDRRGTIRAIHDQGGVAIACHPEGITDWSEFDEADGMEIYNVHATVLKHKNDAAFVAKVIRMLKEDPEHSFGLLQELDPAILARWDEINQKRRFTGIAGNDSHQNVQFFGAQLDPYPRAFKFVSTHVLAEELTQSAILGALKRGDCCVVFDGSRAFSLAEPRAGLSDPSLETRDYERGVRMPGLGGPWGQPTGPFRSEYWLVRGRESYPWVIFNNNPKINHRP